MPRTSKGLPLADVVLHSNEKHSADSWEWKSKVEFFFDPFEFICVQCLREFNMAEGVGHLIVGDHLPITVVDVEGLPQGVVQQAGYVPERRDHCCIQSH